MALPQAYEEGMKAFTAGAELDLKNSLMKLFNIQKTKGLLESPISMKQPTSILESFSTALTGKRAEFGLAAAEAQERDRQNELQRALTKAMQDQSITAQAEQNRLTREAQESQFSRTMAENRAAEDRAYNRQPSIGEQLALSLVGAAGNIGGLALAKKYKLLGD